MRVKSDLRKWVEDGAVTLFRLPLKDRATAGQLGVFGFHLSEDVLQVNVSGFDRPGTLAYLAHGFKKLDLNVESCAGQRLLDSQGSFFEFVCNDENRDKLVELYDFFLRDGGFRAARRVPFNRVYDLFADVPHDQTGLLVPVADLLAANEVNLRQFRADKERGIGLWTADAPVSVFARLEVPFELDLQWLHTRLLDACPCGSTVTLRSVYELVEDRVMKTNRVLTGTAGA